MKQTFKIEKYINSDINLNDKIRVIDGSGLTPVDNCEEEYYIVCSYPKLTGLDAKLKEIVGTVISVGENTNVCMGVLGKVYIQDITIKIGKADFRCCSGFVKKV